MIIPKANNNYFDSYIIKMRFNILKILNPVIIENTIDYRIF